MITSPVLTPLRWLVFVVAAFIMNFPVISTLVTSLKSEAEIASYPGLWIENPTLENYREIFEITRLADFLAINPDEDSAVRGAEGSRDA